MWPFGSGDSSTGSSNAGSSSSSIPATSPSSSENVQDSPTTYFSSESARFDQSRTAFDPSQAPNTQDLFSKPGFDISKLHPLAGLGKDEIEYLDIVDAQPSTLEGGRTALPSRGWSDDLCYGTGTTYLSGASCKLSYF
jgi:import inner membrane translocase subunit TIM23